MKKKICPQIYSHAFLAVLMLFSGTPVVAQTTSRSTDSPAAASMRYLNNSLLHLHGQMQQADANTARTLRSQAATVIAQRAAALSNLIWNDPHAALSFAFSPELLADLAAKFPQSASRLESHTTVSGPVERWTADYPSLKNSRSWLTIRLGATSLNLHFAYQEPPNLKSGDVLQATGVVAGSEMAVEVSSQVQSAAGLSSTSAPTSASLVTATNSASACYWPMLTLLLCGVMLPMPGSCWDLRRVRMYLVVLFKRSAIYGLSFAVFVLSSVPASAQSCSTTGAQNSAVLLVTFPGITPPSSVTTQSMYAMFFGTTGASLDGYWRGASYGQTNAAGNVFGWYTLTGSYSCSNMTQFITDAITAAANSGVDFQTYNRVFIVFPDMSPSCGWAGLSSIGCYSLNSPAGTFKVSTSTLVWNDMTTSDEGTALVAHEAGHQLGLAHARLREFGTEPLGPLGASGTLLEYGDHFSAMGYPNFGFYAAGHKAEQLNWLASGTNYQVVQSSGTYTIQPYETNPAGLDALKIQRGTGNNAWLWMEYRQPVGIYDSTLPAQPFSGALIHYEDSVTGPQTDLLDFTAPSTYTDDPALMAGQSWTDPYTNLSLSVQSATSSGLTVNINYGSVPCTHTNPSITLSPSDPSIYPGNSAGYNLSVTNNDSAGCSASTFNMGSTQPSGWPTTFSASSATLSPGQSGSVTMTKTGPAGTPPGTYVADANASNSSYIGSGTANVTVISTPSLTVVAAVPSASYTRKSSVPITATVLSGGVPASGASVSFTLITPTAGIVTQSAITSSSGTATWSYRLGPKYPTGTYTVTAQASLSATGAGSTLPATSNTVIFTVQ